MSSLWPPARASLDDALTLPCETLGKLEAAQSVDIAAVIAQLEKAEESGRDLRALVSSELPEASWQNREELDALLEKVQERIEARNLEQLRGRLLALAGELERGSIVHRRVVRVEQLNPICMSVPGPWLLDMATTTVAAGRIFKAMINGQPEVPAGWAFDSDGVPTTDTAKAYKGMLMPLGGYKGSGLAMMVEILCSVLSGGAMSTEVGGIRFRGKTVRVSQMYMAIDVKRFMPVEEFTARVEHLVKLMKTTPTAPGYDEVLVAGDPEWRLEAERLRDGIPIAQGNWDMLLKTAARLKVAAPAV